MKRRPAVLVLLAASTLLPGCREAGAEAQQVGPVIDDADIYPAVYETRLDTTLRDFWQDEEATLVVITVPSLEGRTIEDTAFDTFNRLGIGDRRTNRGLLLLVTPNDRKARIEVGCGLESIVTDEVAQEIMDESIIPRFRESDYEGGTTAGTESLMETVRQGGTGHPVSEACQQIMGAAA